MKKETKQNKTKQNKKKQNGTFKRKQKTKKQTNEQTNKNKDIIAMLSSFVLF